MSRKHKKLVAATLATLSLFVGSATAAGQYDNHAHDFAKDVDTFHSVLAPLWHSPPGKERSQQVCAQVAKMESLASAIQSGDAKPLQASVVALRAQCQSRPADIDAMLFNVHEAFHHLVEHK
jgi:hypothetical protein